jgi:hypothetical protein
MRAFYRGLKTCDARRRPAEAGLEDPPQAWTPAPPRSYIGLPVK